MINVGASRASLGIVRLSVQAVILRALVMQERCGLRELGGRLFLLIPCTHYGEFQEFVYMEGAPIDRGGELIFNICASANMGHRKKEKGNGGETVLIPAA